MILGKIPKVVEELHLLSEERASFILGYFFDESLGPLRSRKVPHLLLFCAFIGIWTDFFM